MHLSKLPSGKWRVIVQHEGQKRSGTAPTKTGAQQVGASLLLELGAVPDLIGGHTVGALLDEHLRTKAMSEGARYDFQLIINKTPAWIKNADVQTVQPYTVERWYERLENDGWTRHRIRKLHTLLHSAFKRAKVWRWCETNPITDATAPTPQDKGVVAPNSDITKLLLAAADNYTPAFGAYIRVAANTGARRGEVCGLQWGDVDLDTRTLRLERSISFVPGKGLVISERQTGNKNHGRVIGLGTATVEALRAHHDRSVTRWKTQGVTLGPHSWIFTDDTRTPWTPSFASHAWKEVRQHVPGAEHIKLHALRHAVATRLLTAGVDPKSVAGRLGHTNPNVTLKTYAAFVPARDREAADLLEEGLD